MELRLALHIEGADTDAIHRAAGLCDTSEGFVGVVVPVDSPGVDANALRAASLDVLAASAVCQTTSAEVAQQQTVEWISRAEACGASCLHVTIPPLRREESASGFESYQDCLSFIHQWLHSVRDVVDASGVALGVEAPGNGILLSPVELRELLDLVGSPLVGVCVDVRAADCVGSACDWIRTLGRRVVGIVQRMEAIQPGKLWHGFIEDSIRDSLKQVRFSGPFVVRGGKI